MKVCYSNVSSRPKAVTVQGIKQKIVLMNLLVVLWCVEKAQFGEISIGRAGCTKHLWWSMSVQLDFNVKLGPVNQSAYSLKFGTATIGGLGKTTYHCLYSQASMSKYGWSVQSTFIPLIRSNILATENDRQWKLQCAQFSRIKKKGRTSKTMCTAWMSSWCL